MPLLNNANAVYFGAAAAARVYYGSTLVWQSAATGVEALVNGGFETWSNSTTPGTWTKVIAGGTSAITQETTDVHGGTSAARFAIDATNNNATLTQTVTFTANQAARYSFWHKLVSGSPSIGYQVRIQSGTFINQYLQANGTWSATDPGLAPFAAAASWTKFTRSFTLPAGAGTVRVSIQRSNANVTFLVDDASLLLG